MSPLTCLSSCCCRVEFPDPISAAVAVINPKVKDTRPSEPEDGRAPGGEACGSSDNDAPVRFLLNTQAWL